MYNIIINNLKKEDVMDKRSALSKFFSKLAPGHGSTHGWCNAGCELRENRATGQMEWPDAHYQNITQIELNSICD